MSSNNPAPEWLRCAWALAFSSHLACFFASCMSAACRGCLISTEVLRAVGEEDCFKNLRGETVCKNGQAAAAVNPNTGNAAVAHKNPNGVTTTQTSNGGNAKTKNGSGVAQGPNGTTAAVNARTGNAAVAQKNQNGVTTTQTTNGGEAKTKNGMGVSQGPGGTDCVKGKNHQGCTTKK